MYEKNFIACNIYADEEHVLMVAQPVGFIDLHEFERKFKRTG